MAARQSWCSTCCGSTAAEARAALEQAQTRAVELARAAAEAQQHAGEARRAAERSKAEGEVASRRVAEAEQVLAVEESAKRPWRRFPFRGEGGAVSFYLEKARGRRPKGEASVPKKRGRPRKTSG